MRKIPGENLITNGKSSKTKHHQKENDVWL